MQLYQVDPGQYRQCDKFASENNARLEVVSMSVQKEGDTTFDAYDEDSQQQQDKPKTADRSKAQSVAEQSTLADQFHKLGAPKAGESADEGLGRSPEGLGGSAKEPASSGTGVGDKAGKKRMRCNTCAADCGEAKEYRDHFKSEWHKHNLKRKMINLPPLSAQECEVDPDIVEVKSDLDQYSR